MNEWKCRPSEISESPEDRSNIRFDNPSQRCVDVTGEVYLGSNSIADKVKSLQVIHYRKKMSSNVVPSLVNLPAELSNRIFDCLRPLDILISAQDICTQLDQIIDTYPSYKVNFTIIYPLIADEHWGMKRKYKKSSMIDIQSAKNAVSSKKSSNRTDYLGIAQQQGNVQHLNNNRIHRFTFPCRRSPRWISTEKK